METKRYVVDTSVINQLVDGTVKADELPTDGTFLASHIQLDEISRTKDEKRRLELLQKFTEIIQEENRTDTFVLDNSHTDKADLGLGELYEVLLAELNSRNRKKNNVADALIAETASRKGYVLLNADYNLDEIARAHGIVTQYWPSKYSKKNYPLA